MPLRENKTKLTLNKRKGLKTKSLKIAIWQTIYIKYTKIKRTKIQQENNENGITLKKKENARIMFDKKEKNGNKYFGRLVRYYSRLIPKILLLSRNWTEIRWSWTHNESLRMLTKVRMINIKGHWKRAKFSGNTKLVNMFAKTPAPILSTGSNRSLIRIICWFSWKAPN